MEITDREKVIKGIEAIREFFGFGLPSQSPIFETYQNILTDAISLLKEQEPIHIYEKYPQHDWETDEDGKIDEWAMSYEFHNGPICKRCYHSFCIHCEPNGFNDGPCVIDEYKCPKCESILQKGTKFCSKCGLAVKW